MPTIVPTYRIRDHAGWRLPQESRAHDHAYDTRGKFDMEENRTASKRRLMACLHRPDTALLKHISLDDAVASKQFQSLAGWNRIKQNIAYLFSQHPRARRCMLVPRPAGPKVGPEHWKTRRQDGRRKLLPTLIYHLHGETFLAVG